MIKEISKDDLASFLLGYAAKNKQFKNEFMLNFADKFVDKSDILTYARSLIKSSFTGLGRDGYIEYRDGSKAVKGAEKVLQMAENEDNLPTAVSLCLVVHEEMSAASEKYHDESGYVYGVGEQALDLIAQIVAAFDEDSKDLKQIFDLLMAYISNGRVFGFAQFKEDILEMLLPLCNIKYIREGVE